VLSDQLSPSGRNACQSLPDYDKRAKYVVDDVKLIVLRHSQKVWECLQGSFQLFYEEKNAGMGTNIAVDQSELSNQQPEFFFVRRKDRK
jgi:hypothetical protein